jgi:hypothetical protein
MSQRSPTPKALNRVYGDLWDEINTIRSMYNVMAGIQVMGDPTLVVIDQSRMVLIGQRSSCPWGSPMMIMSPGDERINFDAAGYQ